MNKVVKKLKDEFLENNELLFEKVPVSKEENKELEKKYHYGSTSEHEKINEEYLIEDKIDGKAFYKKKPIDITDDELKEFMFITVHDIIRESNKNISTMKNIMIFWLILTIINLVSILYFASKFAN